MQVDRLKVGKNRDRVYIYLHPGAIVNGKQVCSLPPSLLLSLSLSLSPILLTAQYIKYCTVGRVLIA